MPGGIQNPHITMIENIPTAAAASFMVVVSMLVSVVVSMVRVTGLFFFLPLALVAAVSAAEVATNMTNFFVMIAT